MNECQRTLFELALLLQAKGHFPYFIPIEGALNLGQLFKIHLDIEFASTDNRESVYNS